MIAKSRFLIVNRLGFLVSLCERSSGRLWSVVDSGGMLWSVIAMITDHEV